MSSLVESKKKDAQNDLLARIGADPLFSAIHDSLGALLDPQLFVGRAPQQVTEFIAEDIVPILSQFRSEIASATEVDIKV
jgi:adenylosuccinate lyase